MALELRGVTKRVDGETHIDDATLALSPSGFNVLLGTTRAGKTTLMRLMAGLDTPTTGEVWFRGENVTGVAVQQRNVSMVYQQFINFPNLSVFENIASPLRVGGIKRAEIKRRVEETAELLQLGPMLQRRPAELSGGQQQRTALARALVKDSDLVLLDEPLANLDYKLREALREELPKLLEHKGATVVYATTEPTEALLLGGHTATLHEGRVVQFGPTPEVYRRPVNARSAQVFSDPPINLARVTKRGDELRLNDAVAWQASGPIAACADGDYTAGIRPHHIAPAPKAGAVKVEGEIQITELSGSESLIHFALDGQSWVAQSHGVHPLEVGEHSALYLDVSRCLYFDAEQQLVA